LALGANIDDFLCKPQGKKQEAEQDLETALALNRKLKPAIDQRISQIKQHRQSPK